MELMVPVVGEIKAKQLAISRGIDPRDINQRWSDAQDQLDIKGIAQDERNNRRG